MAYDVRQYNGDPAATVEEGTINSKFDIRLVGKNYAGYGETQNTNFIHLLENFSNNTPPPKATTGQIWYNSADQKLQFNAGTMSLKEWHTIGSVESSVIAPTTLKVGNFWWDTTNSHLYCRSAVGTNIFIGGDTSGIITQMKSRTVTAVGGATHEIIEAMVDNTTIFIISKDADFTLNTEYNDISGFTHVYPGITLSNITGVKFNGTVTNSEQLGGIEADKYINNVTPVFPVIAKFADAGISIGATETLFIYSDLGIPTINNGVSEKIVFNTTTLAGSAIAMELNGADILPGTVDVSNLGSIGSQFDTVYASTFTGNAASATSAATAAQADSVLAGTTYRTASETIAAGTIVARTSSDSLVNGTNLTAGSINANYFVGIATHALAADLAEKYVADAKYETGTVLMIGGEQEVTAAQGGYRALGAVSENPAYAMNTGLVDGTYVALKGRVPVKVIGIVKKGDRLIAADTGVASSLTLLEHAGLVFAIALEDNNDTDIKLVEAVIL
jgi:hypothetical protein